MQKFGENIFQGLFSVLFLLKGIFPSPVCQCRPSDTNRIYPKTSDIASALIYTRLQTKSKTKNKFKKKTESTLKHLISHICNNLHQATNKI